MFTFYPEVYEVEEFRAKGLQVDRLILAAKDPKSKFVSVSVGTRKDLLKIINEFFRTLGSMKALPSGFLVLGLLDPSSKGILFVASVNNEILGVRKDQELSEEFLTNFWIWLCARYEYQCSLNSDFPKLCSNFINWFEYMRQCENSSVTGNC
jgi:hypothetical protein